MIMRIYSVYDLKAEVYQMPFYAHNRGHAMRMIQDVVRNKDSMLAKHPGDFRLLEVGEYNDSNGRIVGFEINKEVVDIIDLFED